MNTYVCTHQNLHDNLHTKIKSISVRTSLTMAPESELDNIASKEHICIHGTSRAG